MNMPEKMGRPAYRLYRLAWAGLDLLYPPHCGGCGLIGSRWCSDCQNRSNIISGPLCQICGRKMRTAGVCVFCKQSPPPFSALRSWGVFEDPLRNAIHRLKYGKDLAMGEILTRPLIVLLESLAWVVDLITPVPLSKARLSDRGYNQSTFLALPLAYGCSKPYSSRALEKTRETRTQVGLSLVERRENVEGAFRAKTELVRDLRVLVVDDVATSGATLEECAAALKEAGAMSVYGMTLARAPGNPHYYLDA